MPTPSNEWLQKPKLVSMGRSSSQSLSGASNAVGWSTRSPAELAAHRSSSLRDIENPTRHLNPCYNREMQIKDGDIIGVTGTGWASGVINAGTFSLPGVGISHVGIVCMHNNSPVVYESTTLGRPACALQQKEVSGTQAHFLEDYVKFVPGKIWHYPLRRPLYPHEIARLQHVLDREIGKAYDLGGAIRSGGFLFRSLQTVLREEDMSTVFCSEWVAHALRQTGVLQVKSVSSWNPNRLCRHVTKTGVCSSPERLN